MEDSTIALFANISTFNESYIADNATRAAVELDIETQSYDLVAELLTFSYQGTQWLVPAAVHLSYLIAIRMIYSHYEQGGCLVFSGLLSIVRYEHRGE